MIIRITRIGDRIEIAISDSKKSNSLLKNFEYIADTFHRLVARSIKARTDELDYYALLGFGHFIIAGEAKASVENICADVGC